MKLNKQELPLVTKAVNEWLERHMDESTTVDYAAMEALSRALYRLTPHYRLTAKKSN